MMRWLTILFCLSSIGAAALTTLAAEVDPAVLQAEAARVAVIDEACRAAITILADGGKDGGSGVIISADGYALSNFHVTEAAGIGMKCGLSNGELYDAVIVGIDPVGDVALVKLFGRNDFPFARLGDSDRMQVGDWAFTVGNPFLLATDFKPSVAYGIISGTHRYQYPSGTLLEYADCLQTDASINPGNSGGPLFNAVGELIGINGRGSFEKRGRVNVGVGYAISINQIKNFLGHLRAGRIVDHATLGARVGSDDQGRVLVSDILEDSDAYRRGLRYGDEIVSFAGRPIRTVNAFKNVLGIFPRGWLVPLVYRHEGQTRETIVRLAGVHGVQELTDKISGKPEEASEPQLEEPKPGEDDKPEKPKAPRRPAMPRKMKHAKLDTLPKIIQEHFEKKRGYTNYFFNRANRTRVWNAFVARGDYRAVVGAWTCQGQWLTPDDSEFRIDDAAVDCLLPGGRLNFEVKGPLTTASDPQGSGGLLAALYLWRRMLVVGPEAFGDVTYAGTLPLPGHPALVDALWGTYGGVECQFLFDTKTGQLLKLELFLAPDSDPCEVTFHDWIEQTGHWLPGRIEVRHAGRDYGMFRVSRWTVATERGG